MTELNTPQGIEEVEVTHPELGTFAIEVPKGISDEEITEYVASSTFELDSEDFLCASSKM